VKKSSFKKVKWGLQFLAVLALAGAGSTTIVAAVEQANEPYTESSATVGTAENKSEAAAPKTTSTNATATASSETSGENEAASSSQQLTILGTSDVHGQIWNWSYEDDQPTPVGLSQINTVVKNERAKNPQGTLLIDNGDMTQGTILMDDLYNNEPYFSSNPNPMITAMNTMKYDAMVLGNHEFNFGLDLIKKIQTEANFPILSANIYNKADGNRFVNGTTTKQVDIDGDGTPDLTVGIIGLTTPHIPNWDGPKVASLNFLPLKEEAEKAVNELKDQADIIVTAIHAGREDADPAASANQVIANVAGIDAYILGHDHASFATKAAAPNGKMVPVAGPKDTGTELVKINLSIERNAGKWQVTTGEAAIVSTKAVAADEEVKAVTKTYHDATRTFITTTLGKAAGDFLPKETIKGIPEAQLQPTAMISLINNVQKEATGAQISAAALFKADSQLEAGALSYANVFDIYKYPNTLVSVPIDGENLLKYMENQAAYYNQPKQDDLTISFNPAIRVYNYDMFSGINYKIDISKPVGQRIVDAKIDGKALEPTATYTLAINNYRYNGLAAQGITVGEPIYSSDPITLRKLIADYIAKKGTIVPADELEANWSVVGYHFDPKWRAAAERLVNDGILQIESAADGRTPNVKPITKQAVQAAGVNPDDSFTIMHTNDVHGRLEGNNNDVLGMAKLKTYKEQQNPTLMIDVGDVFQGLPISNFSKGMDMAQVMNEIGYDAMVVGNHEFDFGYETAMQYKAALNFPILSSNVYKDGQRAFEPYTILEKNGQKYAVIGVTTPETVTKTHPNNVKNVTFADPIGEVEKVIDEILASHSDITAFVVAGHLGIDETTPHEWRGDTLAECLNKKYTALNLVVLDGHSHTAVADGQRYGNVLYAQTGSYLNNVGLVEVSTKDAAQKTAQLISAKSLAALPEDTTVKALVAQAKAAFEQENATVVIPNNPYTFNGERDNVRTRETNLGNLIGDAMLAYGKNGFSHAPDFAVSNGGGIRANIEAGAITKGDVIAVLPFGNSISQIKVTGAQVREMFEMSVRSIPQTDASGALILDDYGQPKLGANGGFLHVSSSIRIYYDSTKPGTLLPNDEGNTTGKTVVGKRVLGIEVQNQLTKAFEPLDDQAEYWMATNDFLAAGGDGYDMLGGEREEGPSLDEVLIQYLQQATVLRMYQAGTTVDLTQYQEPFPGKRIVSISEAAYNQIAKPQPEPKPQPTLPSDTTTPSNPAGNGAAANDPFVSASGKTKGQSGNLPQTGTDNETVSFVGYCCGSLSLAGFYLINKKRKVG
jgi:2',3'-cyclic-nucleotide 2'-phosphodiesterase/3'-nucleotidase/5'-nucleotidase